MDSNLNNNPLITVLMPVYNAENYLAASIESILSQSYQNFEFILIDDGSTDNSKKIILSYKNSRILCLSNDKNLGISSSLNKGIKVSSGKYIARMDADDISHANRLENELLMIHTENADICGCKWAVIDKNGTVIKDCDVPLSCEAIDLRLANTVPFAHGSVLIRKQFLLENNLFYQPHHVAEDYDLWIRMHKAGAKFTNHPDALYFYRHNEQSLSKIKKNEIAAASKKLRKIYINNNLIKLLNYISSFANSRNSINKDQQVDLIFLAANLLFKSRGIKYFLKIFFKTTIKNKIHGIYRVLFS